MSRKSNSHKQLKSSSEQAAYRNFLANSPYSPDDTKGFSASRALRGSDQSYIGEKSEENYRKLKKPLKYRIADWFSDNLKTAIICAIVVGLLGWYAKELIQAKIELSVLNERIDNVKEEIQNIKGSSAEKDIVNLKINEIEQDLDNSNVDIAGLKSRITDLEKEIKEAN